MESTSSHSIISLEHPSVIKILDIAEEIIENNKILTIENLYKITKKRLKLPRKGLLEIIQYLIRKKIIVDGSKHTKNTILNNIYRKKIYFAIKNSNGLKFSSIRKKVFTKNYGSPGQLIWHLEVLIKFGYIKKINIGKFTVFLPIEIEDDIGKLIFFKKNNLNSKIIEVLNNHESIKKSDIFKFLNEKKEKIYYRINTLLENKIIQMDENQNNELFLPYKIKNNVRIITKKYTFKNDIS
ncbi:MAG: hypothetical protein JXA99_05145 [Candidatus Lokiarchaeota archaeon]|nr:hypothetical protein [Candidatus Lokiarchaeota archaeon]